MEDIINKKATINRYLKDNDISVKNGTDVNELLMSDP